MAADSKLYSLTLILALHSPLGSQVYSQEDFNILQATTVALKDYESIDQSLKPFVRYLYLPPSYDNIKLQSVVMFCVHSNSTTVNIDQASLYVLHDNIIRIDLKKLGWRIDNWLVLLNDYPYTITTNPLVIRADWLVAYLTDDTLNKGVAKQLMLNTKLKTVADLQSAFNYDKQLNDKLELRFGHIEARSGVAVQPERIIEFASMLGNQYYTATHDYSKITKDNSPIDRLDLDNTKAEASEIIIGMRKQWKTGSGSLQAYALADGNGSIVFEAPTNIVVDHSGIDKNPAIRSSLSCIKCHTSGLLSTTLSKLAQQGFDTTEIYSNYEDKDKIEKRFVFVETNTFISQAKMQYDSAVQYITGMEVAEFVNNHFTKFFDKYNKQLDVNQVAKELTTTVDKLKQYIAIADYTTGSLAALINGGLITREYFESVYKELYIGLHAEAVNHD